MNATFKMYGDENQKWIFAPGYLLLDTKYTKTKARKILKAEPVRKIVQVYDYANRYGLGFDKVCSVVVWAAGKKCVMASGIKKQERIPLLCGQVSIGHSSSHMLKTEILLQKLLLGYAPSWKQQIVHAFGFKPDKVNITNVNGHVYASANALSVEILPD